MGHRGPGREEERLGCGDRSACRPLSVWGRCLAWCRGNLLLVLCVLVALPSLLAPVDRLLFFPVVTVVTSSLGSPWWCGSRPVCVCLSVSCQWFYPMVGYIMLFYHRVEPRTGYRGTLCIEETPRLPGHKQPSSQGLAPLGTSPCWCSSSLKGL